MSVYLDTSVLAGIFIEADVFAGQAARFFTENRETLIVSDFAAAEFASVVARVTRMKDLTEIQARAIFLSFDSWRDRFADAEEATPSDIEAADIIIRRLDLNIRAPDAINLAMAHRLEAAIATFDRRMIENAHALGLAVAAV